MGISKPSGATALIWGTLTLLPLLVKLVLILHIYNPDPVVTYAAIQSEYVRLNNGEPTIDPNIGFTAHALGHEAAEDLLHGRMPWWNPYEGIGAPLAGEMQSAALLPLNLLLHFKDGQLFMHLAFQIIAGFATYFLLRRLGAGAMAALIGGILFEFNGTFGWLANAVINPIPFLPLTLIGVEKAWEHAVLMRLDGWAWISIGIALSLYAGFPEVAYLDGLLIAAWTVTRASGLRGPQAGRFIASVGLGLVVGLLLSAPILIAFFDYLPAAYVAAHTSDGFRFSHLFPDHFVNLPLPYLFGLIFDKANPDNFWGGVGGYAGVALIGAAAVGAYGARLRRLRILLAAWIILCWAASYGVQVVADAWMAIPAVGLSAFFRYFPPSWEFALAILASFGVDDMAQSLKGELRKRVMVAVLAAAAILLIGLVLARGHIAHAVSVVPETFWYSAGFGGAIFFCLAALSFVGSNARACAAAFGCIACVEAVAYFAVPIVSYPVKSNLNLGPVTFLQSHIGFHRFFTLGPIAPNYGSYFGIAELNHNDLPVPKDWVSYIQARLDDNIADGVLFVGEGVRKNLAGPTVLSNLIRNQESFRKLGVKYLVAEAGRPVPLKSETGSGDSLDAQLVYSDPQIKIYELENPSPYFSADHCEIRAQSRDGLGAKCDAVSKLTRLELYMPGWTAEINGRSVPVSRVDGLVQGVELPQGVSRIRFKFEPPYMAAGYAMFALALTILGAHATRRPSRRPKSL